MKTTVLSWEDVTKLLPMKDCLGIMRETLKALARGDAVLPLRRYVQQPDKRGTIGVMPAFLGDPQLLGAKIISVFPGNRDTRFESHQGAVILFETQNGRLLAMVDASSITAIRTAAVSGVATDVLANRDAESLAILGSGTQASTHLSSMLLVRPVRSVKVWSRDFDHAKRFASSHSDLEEVRVEAVRTAEEALKDSSLVCTTTAAKSPVLEGAWLSPGAHVNAVGASVPPFRELDTEAVRKSRLFVDRRESALNESDDILIPIREGIITDEHILGELGEVLLGRVAGRRNAEEITLFKSMGIAVEDIAAAHHVYARALQERLGTQVEFNSER
jgi:ornithine cyclodeaminase/alanine dehydrogenase-like protein (mu-crystallin family)